MIVLLVASSVVAALAPIPEPARDDPTTTSATEATATGRSQMRILRANAGKPETIRVRAGDQLALEVVGQEYDLVEIRALGQLEDLDPQSPARFDLLLDEPGTYAVRLTHAQRLIGRIKVAQAQAGADQPAVSDELGGAVAS